MTQLWQISKNMMGWWLDQEDDQCNCDYHDDDENALQESSGVGTIIGIYTVLAGLFIGANVIPRQLTQGSPTLRNRETRKQQQHQRRRSRHSANGANKRSRKKLVLDNWQDAVQLTDEEESHRLQLKNRAAPKAKELYFDLPADDGDDDHFVEVKDD